MVAYAAPATPILKLIINTKSKITFKTDDIIKKYNGVLLSPNALNILAIKLYATVVTSPP